MKGSGEAVLRVTQVKNCSRGGGRQLSVEPFDGRTRHAAPPSENNTDESSREKKLGVYACGIVNSGIDRQRRHLSLGMGSAM